jgi:hypothetical protein
MSEQTPFQSVPRSNRKPPATAPPAPSPRAAQPPAVHSLLIVAAVIGGAIWLGLRHAAVDPAQAGAAGGAVFGLLVGAALPGWCQRLGDRLGISKRTRGRR